jgi:hypothetical protein
MPGLKKPVQQESPKVIAIAATQDMMSGAGVWLYALFASSLAWFLLNFIGK